MRTVKAIAGVVVGLALVAAPLAAQAGQGRAGMGRGMAAGGPAAMARNPVAVLLDHRADLGLTEDQVGRLESLSQRVAAENGPRWEQLRAAFGDEAPADMTAEERARLRERMRALDPVRAEVRETNRAAMDEARSVLTADQLEKLPTIMRRGPRHGERGAARPGGRRDGQQGPGGGWRG